VFCLASKDSKDSVGGDFFAPKFRLLEGLLSAERMSQSPGEKYGPGGSRKKVIWQLGGRINKGPHHQ
jgi:hypothetical protein